MKSGAKQGYIVLALLFVVFSVIAFVAPFAKTPVFWISYVFAVIAIVLQVFVFHIVNRDGEDAKSRFYGFPILKISAIYLFVQFIVSLVEMLAAAMVPLWVVLIINGILFTIALIGCMADNSMKEEISRMDTQLKSNVRNMRNLQSLSASLASQCNDTEMKAAIRQLANQFQFSDPISSDATMEIEAELQTLMDEVQTAVVDGDRESVKALCDRTMSILQERNRLCRLNK